MLSHTSKGHLLLRAARGEAVERVPVWLMRQAGRYLEEYRAVRERHGFLEVVKTPELAVEVSLQPWRIFRPDGVILFSDILTPLEGMGIPFHLDERGPVIDAPVRTRAEVDRVKVVDPFESVPYVLDALRMLRNELHGEAPVIGFAGAPYTLAHYAVGPAAHAKESAVKTLAYEDPVTLHHLLEKLADQTAAYLAAQVDAGAEIVQLFDTWAGELGFRDYQQFALPYQQRAIESIRHRVPVILFVLGGSAYVELLAASGAQVLSLDWRMPLGRAREEARRPIAVQGNLDPAILLGPARVVEERILAVLEDGDAPGHIFNLGHGLLPATPRENVTLLFDTVRGFKPSRQT